MEASLHRWVGTAVVFLSLALAAVAWARVRGGAPPTKLLKAFQGVAHLLLTVQVLLGVGLLLRGGQITMVHPIVGVLALLSLLLPIIVPALKANKPLAAAVTPTLVTILSLIAYALGEGRAR